MKFAILAYMYCQEFAKKSNSLSSNFGESIGVQEKQKSFSLDGKGGRPRNMKYFKYQFYRTWGEGGRREGGSP